VDVQELMLLQNWRVILWCPGLWHCITL